MTLQVERLTTALADRYTIERELGAGGMATVYLAEDLKHHRKVAVKVLRPELAAVLGAERFLAEIEVTANLQHPNILPLYDSGEADTFLFYVMPFVEGESLRDRLDHEKQLAVEEAVEIARSVAAALHYAHERDVIHRDIKPENILLQSGQALVADFGIALAVSQAGGARLTGTGLSLGTPFYMSPEQATGDRDLDVRSDVYSLGALTYEMLTGDPPHTGTTAQAIIASVVTEEPRAVTVRRSTVPTNVESAVHKALAKIPADRFKTAAKFADALTDEAFRLSTLEQQVAEPGGVAAWRQRWTVPFGIVAALMAGLALWGWARPVPQRGPVERFVLTFPQDPGTGWGMSFSLLPDGTGMVYVRFNAEGTNVLALRRWSDLHGTDIHGTEGGVQPTVSPDGNAVAFFRSVGGTLAVVPLSGGAPRELTTAGLSSAIWASDNWIYFTDGADGISRVRATGGPVEKVTELRPGDARHMPGDLLPDGDALVFTMGAPRPEVAVADLQTGEITGLMPGSVASFVGTGHLLVITDDGTLVAVPFDPGAKQIQGPSTQVLDETLAIVSANTRNQATFDVSQNGTLVYRRGVTLGHSPVWVNRDGSHEEIEPGWEVVDDMAALSVALSPDGGRVAVTNDDHLWIKQIGSRAISRITSTVGLNGRPSWAPNGRSVTFISDRTGRPALWQRQADGTGTATNLVEHERPVWEGAITPDGSSIVYRFGSEGSSRDIYMRRADGTGDDVPLLSTSAQERAPAVSHDGRWLAYQSNETGRDEIYVRPFPNVQDGLWAISTNGGTGPLWAHSGRELFYRDGAGNFIAVDVITDPIFTPGEQHVLFSANGFASFVDHALYDISPDDQRFVMLRENEGDVGFVLVQNWFEELKERLGT